MKNKTVITTKEIKGHIVSIIDLKGNWFWADSCHTSDNGYETMFFEARKPKDETEMFDEKIITSWVDVFCVPYSKKITMEKHLKTIGEFLSKMEKGEIEYEK